MSSLKDGDTQPRWNIVNKLYSKIDKTLDTAFIDNKCSFIEVEIVMLMVNEKISQQKHEMYSLYLKHKETEEAKEKEVDKKEEPAPSDLYK